MGWGLDDELHQDLLPPGPFFFFFSYQKQKKIVARTGRGQGFAIDAPNRSVYSPPKTQKRKLKTLPLVDSSPSLSSHRYP